MKQRNLTKLKKQNNISLQKIKKIKKMKKQIRSQLIISTGVAIVFLIITLSIIDTKASL